LSGNTNKETIFNFTSDVPKDYTGIAIFKIFEDAARKEWYVEGKRHRIDGPALIHEDGSKSWYRNGKLHREDGPARIRNNCLEWWWRGMCCHGQKPIGDYIVIQDGLPSKVYWMRDRNFVTQKKVLTPEGIMYIPNLPGI
jgi:hypothetical protein